MTFFTLWSSGLLISTFSGGLEYLNSVLISNALLFAFPFSITSIISFFTSSIDSSGKTRLFIVNEQRSGIMFDFSPDLIRSMLSKGVKFLFFLVIGSGNPGISLL